MCMKLVKQGSMLYRVEQYQELYRERTVIVRKCHREESKRREVWLDRMVCHVLSTKRCVLPVIDWIEIEID
jgi:hypothetical protein